MKRTWGRYWPFWLLLAAVVVAVTFHQFFEAWVFLFAGYMGWSCGAMAFDIIRERKR